jgi:hypothetical protein
MKYWGQVVTVIGALGGLFAGIAGAILSNLQ